MLQVPSLSTTKRIAGIGAFHIGMRIRPHHVSAASVGSAGHIIAIDFAPLTQWPHSGSTSGEVLLQHQPRAIYVQLDDVDLEFLPPKPELSCLQKRRSCAGVAAHSSVAFCFA